jgi:cobalamin transport system substrate-binding protein
MPAHRNQRFLGWLAALAVCLFACQRRTPEPAARPERVVSLSPSTTEAVFALGAGPRLVGRSLYSDYPPEAERIPSVGGFADPSYEAILGRAPTLVVGVRGPSGRSIVDRLKQQGIATYFPPTDSVAEILDMLRGLGTRLGEAARGTELAAKVAAERDRVLHAVAGLPHPRALLVFGVEPIVVAGPGGFPDELLRLAGAVNVVKTGPRFPTIGVEELLALDPDVIVDTTGMGGGHTHGVDPQAPGWKELRAVNDGRLVRLTDERVLRPGPRIAEGLAVLARALHPGAKIP